MFVSIGNSRMDKKFNCTDMTYEDFVSRLSKTKYTAETMEQYRKMPKGLKGTVTWVDDTGTIGVNWENGSSLGVIYGVDSCKKIE